MDPEVLKIIIFAAATLIIACVAIVILTSRGRRYKRSQYFKVTGNTQDDLKNDSGKSSEYNIYASLHEYEKKGARFLFNTYIPLAKGGTTELDALMICKKGIFVFESKSRYGWIEGKESEREWKQLLFRRDGSLIENKLYNPIMQNHGHIAHLRKLLGGNVKMWSVIVFSDRTDIQRISVSYPDTYLTTESELKRIVGNVYWNAKDALTENDITSIYFKLYQYTRVTDEDKEKHIRYIKKTYVDKKPAKAANAKNTAKKNK